MMSCYMIYACLYNRKEGADICVIFPISLGEFFIYFFFLKFGDLINHVYVLPVLASLARSLQHINQDPTIPIQMTQREKGISLFPGAGQEASNSSYHHVEHGCYGKFPLWALEKNEIQRGKEDRRRSWRRERPEASGIKERWWCS
jgi:hypothetical protein